MASLAVACVLDVPPEKAYRILADYREHHPQILPRPEFASLDVLEGGVGAGTRVRVVMHVLRASTTLTMRVDEPEPGRVLRETDEATGVVTTFTVTPEGAGARVEIATTWPERPGVRARIERWVARRVAKGLYARELAQLEAYAKTLL